MSVVPDWIDGLYRLAWIRATHAKAATRNAIQALTCAERLRKFVGDRDPMAMDVYAAALAEAGRFAEAATAATTALQLAKDRKNDQLARRIEGRMKLYRQGQPYREPQ